MFRNRITACAVLLGLSCGSVNAEGLYVGAGFGQLSLEDSAGPFVLDASDTAFKLFGGYQVNENFAAEIAYINGGTPEDNLFGATVELEPTAVQASLIGTLPVSNVFGLYARAALLSWRNDILVTDGFNSFSAEASGEDFSWGVGGVFGFSKGRLRLEYEGADLDGTDIAIFTISGAIDF